MDMKKEDDVKKGEWILMLPLFGLLIFAIAGAYENAIDFVNQLMVRDLLIPVISIILILVMIEIFILKRIEKSLTNAL